MDAGEEEGVLWDVVGGADKGGILVRTGEALSSPAEEMRLATGAVVRQLALAGERLHFARVSGAGPERGWVSTRITGKALLTVRGAAAATLAAPAPAVPAPAAPAPAAAAPASAAPAPSPSPSPAPSPSPPATAAAERSGDGGPGMSVAAVKQRLASGRRLRVLALHGGGSNTTAMKWQTAQLRLFLGKTVDWEFLNGRRPWASEVDPGTKAIAPGEPYWGWYAVDVCEPGGPSNRPYLEKLFDEAVVFTYDEVDVGVDHVMRCIKEKGPFDILLGFSQGCIVSHLVAATLLARGEKIPWRLSVQFCGMRVRDNRYLELFDSPLPVPCVQIYGRSDPMYEYGRKSQPQLYESPLILEFDEGHRFPSKDPAKTEIHRRIAEEIVRVCLADGAEAAL